MAKETIFELPAYGWKPRRDQMALWTALMKPDFRRGVVVAHRRWGKDEAGLQATAVKAMERVGSYGYMLPEYAQARRAIWEHVNWRTGRTRIEDAFPPEIVSRRDNQTMMLWLESGSTVQLLGSDSYDSIVGAGYAGLVQSEAALSNPKAMQYFRPMLEESGGWELQISTPRGKNAFYRAYTAAREDMLAGDSTVYAERLTAETTGVFPAHQLLRIKMDYIREYGHTIGEAMFDQEYMVSWDAALVGAVWGKELTELEAQGRARTAPHDKRYVTFTSWDIGIADATAILFWQIIDGEYRLIDAVEETSIGLDTYIAILKDLHFKHGYNYGTHYAPHDIQNREWLRGVSRLDEAKRLGLTFKRTPQTRVRTQIAAGAQLIKQMVVNTASPGATRAYDRFKAYRFNRVKSTGTLMDQPVHDEASHSSSALMTMAINVASKLDLGGAYKDEALHADSDVLNRHAKFDPRQFGRDTPYGHDGNVSGLMRGRRTGGTAFG